MNDEYNRPFEATAEQDDAPLGNAGAEARFPASSDTASSDAASSDPFAILPALLREALIKKGFKELTSVQQSVAGADTMSRDLRISSQTGSGKTVAIGIALGRELLSAGTREQRVGPTALVLTPTRELAAQVQKELGWLLRDVPDAQVEVVTGGTSVGMERKRLAQKPRVLVGTPGRVLDHLERKGFSGEKIQQVILDEADQMLELGFRDELHAILDHLPKERRTHFVSATFSGEVEAVARQHQEAPLALQGSPLGRANADIQHIAHVVPPRHRHDALVNLLLTARATVAPGEGVRALVFTRTRVDTLETAEKLQREGFRAEPLSGELAQAQRTRTLAAFRSGQVEVVVATDVAARGLDVDGIDQVIHLEPPSDPDAFTHRSGRTGRAGRKGTSVLLLPPQARQRIERLLQRAGVRAQWAPVPGPDKIKKLYSKLAKRRLFDALAEEADPAHLEYTKKLLEDHPAEEVVARLLAMVEIEPSSPPREISSHFTGDHRGRPRTGEPPRGRGPHAPKGRPREHRPFFGAPTKRGGPHQGSAEGEHPAARSQSPGAGRPPGKKPAKRLFSPRGKKNRA